MPSEIQRYTFHGGDQPWVEEDDHGQWMYHSDHIATLITPLENGCDGCDFNNDIKNALRVMCAKCSRRARPDHFTPEPEQEG